MKSLNGLTRILRIQPCYCLSFNAIDIVLIPVLSVYWNKKLSIELENATVNPYWQISGVWAGLIYKKLIQQKSLVLIQFSSNFGHELGRFLKNSSNRQFWNFGIFDVTGRLLEFSSGGWGFQKSVNPIFFQKLNRYS